MAPIWQPKPIAVLREWANAILTEASDDLNDWETMFMVDIDYQLALGRPLTQTQEEKLEKIYVEKTD
jgi:hypothetical protein